MKEDIEFVIVVPCYNEEQRIDLEEFFEMTQSHPHLHICFVDDGSTDNTARLITNFVEFKQSTQMSLIEMEFNCGKGEAVRQGLLQSLVNFPASETFGFLDADAATPPLELQRMQDYMRRHDHLDVVLGSRVKLLGRHIQRKVLRHYISRIFATLASLLLELPIYDTQCGAKIFKRNILKEVLQKEFQCSWLFDIELLLRMIVFYSKGQNLTPQLFAEKVHEYPLHIWVHKEGSKLKPLDFLRAPFELVKLWRYKKTLTGRYLFFLSSKSF